MYFEVLKCFFVSKILINDQSTNLCPTPRLCVIGDVDKTNLRCRIIPVTITNHCGGEA